MLIANLMTFVFHMCISVHLSLTCIYLIKLKSNLIYRTFLCVCVCVWCVWAFVYACVQVVVMLELPLIAALLLVRGKPFATSLL